MVNATYPGMQEASKHPSDSEGDGDIDLDLLDDAAGPSHSLLGWSLDSGPWQDSALSTTGRVRAYWLGIVVSFGGFLFGYDSGIIGGVLTLESFAQDFHYTLPNSHTAALSVSVQQLGAFAACFAIWPITHRYGRKWPIVWCSAIFIFGAVIQTVNSHHTSVFYLGRLISGIGLGGCTVITPMFSSEAAPKEMRGSIGSFYQWMFTLGIFTSYWLDLGVAKYIPNTQSRQWQIPVGLQCLFAAALAIGTLTLKESPRWLAQKGRHDAGWDSLRWIRADDGIRTRDEMEEIRKGIEIEMQAREGFKLREMLAPPHAKRTVTAAAVFTAQQATGATAFAYLGPQYFQLIVGKSGTTSLLLTAIFGAVKVVSCTLFVIFVADNFDRRVLLTTGAAVMGVCQLTTALLIANPLPSDGENESSSASTGLTISAGSTIALIYLFVAAYNFSWGPLPWPYVSEIFPARTRESGIALGVAFQWLGNFVFSFTTPYMIATLGGGTFVVWGILDMIIALYAWTSLVETRGRSLEAIAHGIEDYRRDPSGPKAR